ncbi:hypothetical protein ACTXT7_017270, partial [Hymenolepis weldensis]
MKEILSDLIESIAASYPVVDLLQSPMLLAYSFAFGIVISSTAKTLKDTYGNDVVNEKDDFSLIDGPRAGCSKNSILSNCKLPLMKIQPALLENCAKPLT